MQKLYIFIEIFIENEFLSLHRKENAVYISKFMKYIKSTDIAHRVILPIMANISRYNLTTLQSNYNVLSSVLVSTLIIYQLYIRYRYT